MRTTLKLKVFDILDKSEQNGFLELVYDIIMILLIVSNVIAVVVEPSIKNAAAVYFLRVFEIVSVAIFTVEYLLRFWVADCLKPAQNKWIARFLYIITPMALIDLASILPFYIPFMISVDLRVLRMLRIFRLLRLFKANRYTDALTTVLKVIKRKADQLLSSFFVIITLMIITSVLMFNIENNAQPEIFTSVFDAMWWSVATFTTVGYGDIYPVTGLGKLLAAIIAILGIGIVAIPTGIIASGFTELIQTRKAKSTCPHCGKEIES
jgi:voltage-gated potassium channel